MELQAPVFYVYVRHTCNLTMILKRGLLHLKKSENK